MKTRDEYIKALGAWLDKIDENATSWAHATDEVRDMAIGLRKARMEITGEVLDHANWRFMSTPAQWNSSFKAQIIEDVKHVHTEWLRFYLDHLPLPETA